MLRNISCELYKIQYDLHKFKFFIKRTKLEWNLFFVVFIRANLQCSRVAIESQTKAKYLNLANIAERIRTNLFEALSVIYINYLQFTRDFNRDYIREFLTWLKDCEGRLKVYHKNDYLIQIELRRKTFPRFFCQTSPTLIPFLTFRASI